MAARGAVHAPMGGSFKRAKHALGEALGARIVREALKRLALSPMGGRLLLYTGAPSTIKPSNGSRRYFSMRALPGRNRLSSMQVRRVPCTMSHFASDAMRTRRAQLTALGARMTRKGLGLPLERAPIRVIGTPLRRPLRWHDECSAFAMTTESNASPPRILVAEDNLDMRQLVADCLRRDGYEVQEVADGDELLVRIEETFALQRTAKRLDLVVTDVNMPGYTGLEILTGIRDAGLTIPVILMTASQNDSLRAEAGSLHAAFLQKPFLAEQLRELVRSVLRQLGSGETPRASEHS